MDFPVHGKGVELDDLIKIPSNSKDSMILWFCDICLHFHWEGGGGEVCYT